MPDLPYDYEDLGLTPSELKLKYREEGCHPEYTGLQWSNSLSDLEYWEWVADQISQDDLSH